MDGDGTYIPDLALLFMIQLLPFVPGHLFLEFQVSLTFLNTAFIFVQTVNFFNTTLDAPIL